MYLLDANVLIRAHADYYPIERVPEFWDWLVHHGQADALKVPAEIFEEVVGGGGKPEEDAFLAFLRRADVKAALILDEAPRADLVQHVLDRGYAPALTDVELVEIGRDPFLVAYAAVDPARRTVVTLEVSAPAKQRANRRVPDVCAAVGVMSCNPFALYRQLGFSTDWRRGAG